MELLSGCAWLWESCIKRVLSVGSGRLVALEPRDVHRKRDDLIVKVDCDREVTWDEVIRKARVPKGDVSTAGENNGPESGAPA